MGIGLGGGAFSGGGGGGGGSGGFSFGSLAKLAGGGKGIAGGLTLLGSAFVQFQAQREQAKVASEEQERLQRERQAAQIQNQRAQAARNEDRRRQIGTLRARFGAQGLDLSTGSALRLIDLTAGKFDQEDQDAATLAQLEAQGFTSAIGATRRARSAAQVNQFLLPGLSLVGSFGGRL